MFYNLMTTKPKTMYKNYKHLNIYFFYKTTQNNYNNANCNNKKLKKSNKI